MNTMGDDTFDYQAICEKRRRTRRRFGAELLSQQRFDAAMKRLTVRIDEELLQQFSQLAAEGAKGKSHEQLINQVLREWFYAKGMKKRCCARKFKKLK